MYRTLHSRPEIFWVSSATLCVFSASLILAIMISSFILDSRSAYCRFDSRTCFSRRFSLSVFVSRLARRRSRSSLCRFSWFAMTWF